MKLKCLISVPDKITHRQYEAGETYEFEEARGKEVLEARTRVTKEPYFELVVENVENYVENDLEKVEKLEVVVLEEITVKELKEIASQMNIEGYSKMKKDQLIEAIKNND